ncbi:MAG TPA: Uma2 family endonuclease, partial [Pyrinomonadaceae bacterium]|nr:Uma2 family endonuclease [Pyrinomonadaceae bacterium]
MAHNLTELDEYIPADVARLMHEKVSPEQYEELVYKHEDLWLELTSSGELIVIPPKGLAHGNRSSRLTYQVAAWARTDRSGVCFGSSTVFALPDGSRRIPDASWIKREKWDSLTKDEREGFGPFC